MKSKIIQIIGQTFAAVLLSSTFFLTAHAGEGALLGISPGFPNISFTGATGQGCVYDSTNDTLTITATPGFAVIGAGGPFGPVTSGLLTMVLNIDSAGNLSGGSFTLNGGLVPNFGPSYADPLLTGSFAGSGDYGIVDMSPDNFTDVADMRAVVTGGSMASLWTGASLDIGVAPLSLDFSTYAGTMGSDWMCGRAKGGIGSVPGQVVGAGACSQGFWKNHVDQWPLTDLFLGSISYNQTQLLAILNMKAKGDKSIILAKQLIAAKLNVAGGSDPACIQAIIDAADDWLDLNAPGGIPGSVSDWNGGQDLKDDLDDFNNGACAGACER